MPSASRNSRRRARIDRSARSNDRRFEAMPPVDSPLPPLELLDEDRLLRIVGAAFDVLQDAGIEFLSQKALRLLERNGVVVDQDAGLARFDRDTLEHFVGLAPSRIDVHARVEERNTWFGGNRINFGTVAGAPNFSDSNGGRRPGSYEALCDLIRLNQALGVAHVFGSGLVEPVDLPVATRHLDTVHALLKYSDRPVVARTVSDFRAEDAIEMVAIARGVSRDQMRREPSVITSFNVNSPRRVDAELLDGLTVFAEAGQITAITPFTLAGAMSPVTLAGALVQQTAEALAVIAYSQMVRAGAPVLFGGFTSNVDMKSGSPAFGTPEYVQATLIGGQLARHFGLPYRSSNVTASNTVDAQSTYEAALSLQAVMMGHANLVHHGLGWLEGGLTASFEKTVVDAEMIRAMALSLAPVDVSDAALAVDVIKAVPPGGHFFGEGHTLERFETAFYQPMISDWRNFETWFEDGRRTATDRANDLWKQLLADCEAPAMDESVDEALKDFMARRKAALAGSE